MHLSDSPLFKGQLFSFPGIVGAPFPKVPNRVHSMFRLRAPRPETPESPDWGWSVTPQGHMSAV